MPDPIQEALADCNPNLPLEPGDKRYVDLDDLRGVPLRKSILKKLRAADTRQLYAKIAVAGHRGSGKSTEISRAQKELVEQGYITLWASVNENLDPKDISFSDVMRLIILLIDDRFGAQADQYPAVKQAFDVVRDWFRQVTKTFSKEIGSAKEFGLKGALGGKASLELGGEANGLLAKAGLKFKTDLGELAASINVVRRSEGKERTEIKETLERYNNQLVDNVNSLLRAVAAIDGSKLVIILDNVDKYDPETVNAAFLRHASLFQSLDCHLIFTIQSSLLHQPVEDGVEESFGTISMPMLPVFLRHTRNPDPAVLAKLREAVYLRVPQNLFADGDAAADQIILASGGCWRDLLRLLEAALLSADDRIAAKDVKTATQQVAQIYQRRLQQPADLTTLAQAHLNHTILADERARYLLHHLCILAYNGEGWYDIHPLLDTYPPVKKAIDDATKS